METELRRMGDGTGRSRDGVVFERRETHLPPQFPVPEVKFPPGAVGHMAAELVS